MGVEEDTISLTKWFFKIPSSKITSLLIILWSFLVALIISISNPATFGQTIIPNLVSTTFTIIIPAILTAICITILIKKIGLNRTLFISYIGAIIYGINYIIYSLTLDYMISIFTFGFVFIIWFITLYIFFGLRKSAILFAVFQLLFSLIFFIADTQTINQNVWGLLAKIYLSAIIMLLAVFYSIKMINAPMKKNIGISSTDAASLFFEQWMFGSNKMEEMILKISEQITTNVDWINLENDKLKLKLVTPYVHFGPFGTLGGSQFSELIPEKIGQSIVFHAPVTRDYNPASEKSLDIIVKAIQTQKMTKTIKGNILKIKTNNAYADVIRLNDYVIVGLSRAPNSTEDIDPGLGQAIKSIIETQDLGVLLIDMHNCETNDIKPILPGSEGAEEYLTLAKEISNKIKSLKLYDIKIGYSEIKQSELSKKIQFKIAGAGIKIISFILKNKTYTMVVLDSNGITPKAKEILNQLECEVYTTDTHAVNTVKGVINPITEKEVMEIKELIKTAIHNSINNAQEMKGAYNSKKIILNVLGRNKTTEIVTTLNATIAMIKIIIPMIIILSIIVIMWMLSYLQELGV